MQNRKESPQIPSVLPRKSKEVPRWQQPQPSEPPSPGQAQGPSHGEDTGRAGSVEAGERKDKSRPVKAEKTGSGSMESGHREVGERFSWAPSKRLHWTEAGPDVKNQSFLWVRTDIVPAAERNEGVRSGQPVVTLDTT